MGSGCGDPIVDKILRPPGKLPVPVALNAGSPTLFEVHYSGFYAVCKQVFAIFGSFLLHLLHLLIIIKWCLLF